MGELRLKPTFSRSHLEFILQNHPFTSSNITEEKPDRNKVHHMEMKVITTFTMKESKFKEANTGKIAHCSERKMQSGC